MKLWNYIFIMVTMLLFFTFMGWTGAGINPVSNYTGINITTVGNQTELTGFDLTNSPLRDWFSNIWLLGLVGAGIALGLYLTGQGDIAIRGGVASAVLVGFASLLYIPLNYGFAQGVSPWAVGIAAMIFIPFSIGFFISLVEWVTGSDN